MDSMGYRSSGELSDITVVVDGEEFALHKFPLFLRSEYFRNLSALSDETPSKVVLDNFPGGSKVFSIVADYCYNKEVKINMDNVIEVICAAEYLKMTGGMGRGGLSVVADNVLFDLSYATRNKRDYGLSLFFIVKASQFIELVEKSGLYRKLIESFVENLTIYIKTSAIYESIHIYSKSAKFNSSIRSLHNIALNEEQIEILNNLPMKWMNDLVKCAIRYNLNQGLITYIIQNYIDFNTKLIYKPADAAAATESRRKSDCESEKDSCVSAHEEAQDNKSYNLIEMTGDILKLSPLGPEVQEDQEASNLIGIAGDILNEKPNNLLDVETNENNQDNSYAESNEDEGEQEVGAESTFTNLVNIASNILIESSEADPATETDLTEAGEALNLKNIASDILIDNNGDGTSNLKDIAGDILAEPSHSNLKNITADILGNSVENDSKKGTNQEPMKAKTKAANLVSDEEKIEVIKNLTTILIDLRIDPQFPLPWLMLYSDFLNNLKAETYLRVAFTHWIWNALTDPKLDSKELIEITPEALIQLANEILLDIDYKNEINTKLVELMDRYIVDMNAEQRLDIETFQKLAACIPKSKRTNFDDLTSVLLSLLQKDTSLTPEKQSELIELIDLQKVNENLLEECKNSQFIPAHVVTNAALGLCSKLRKELDEAKLMNKTYEMKSRPLSSLCPDHSSIYSSSYSTKYNKNTRNRSIEPSAGENRAGTSPMSNLTSKTTYPLKSVSPTGAYRSSLASTRQYSSALSKVASACNPKSSVLNSTYKASSFNPSTSYAPHSHHSHTASYLDYISDDAMFDYASSGTKNYLDDEDEYYCPAHQHYQYYPRIY